MLDWAAQRPAHWKAILADIKESVQELRYYREAVFVPQPGPDSITARVIAARYSEPGAADGAEAVGAAGSAGT